MPDCLDLYRRRWNTIAARIEHVSIQHLDILIEVLCEKHFNIESIDPRELSMWYRSIIESIEKHITSLTRYIEINKSGRNLDKYRDKLTELQCTLTLLGNEESLYKYMGESQKYLCSATSYKTTAKRVEKIILRYCRNEYMHYSTDSIRPGRELLFSRMEKTTRENLTPEEWDRILTGYLDSDTNLQDRVINVLQGTKDLPKKEKILEYFRKYRAIYVSGESLEQNEGHLLEYYGISSQEIQTQLKRCWFALSPDYKEAITLVGPSSLSEVKLDPGDKQMILNDEEYCKKKYGVKLATMKKRYIDALNQLRDCMNL